MDLGTACLSLLQSLPFLSRAAQKKRKRKKKNKLPSTVSEADEAPHHVRRRLQSAENPGERAGG